MKSFTKRILGFVSAMAIMTGTGAALAPAATVNADVTSNSAIMYSAQQVTSISFAEVDLFTNSDKYGVNLAGHKCGYYGENFRPYFKVKGCKKNTNCSVNIKVLNSDTGASKSDKTFSIPVLSNGVADAASVDLASYFSNLNLSVGHYRVELRASNANGSAFSTLYFTVLKKSALQFYDTMRLQFAGIDATDATRYDYAYRLSTKAISGTWLAMYFYDNSSYLQNCGRSTYVTRLYKGVLFRSPDDGGYNYWMGVMNTEPRRSILVNGFLGSAEFTALCNRYGVRAR